MTSKVWQFEISAAHESPSLVGIRPVVHEEQMGVEPEREQASQFAIYESHVLQTPVPELTMNPVLQVEQS